MRSSARGARPTSRCLALIRRRRWLSVIAVVRHGHRKGQGRRADRTHPLGKRRRVLFRLHDRDAAKRVSVGRQPRCRFLKCRPDLANGLGLASTRTTAAQPTCRSRRAAITPAASTRSSPTVAFISSRTPSAPSSGEPGHGRRWRGLELRPVLSSAASCGGLPETVCAAPTRSPHTVSLPSCEVASMSPRRFVSHSRASQAGGAGSSSLSGAALVAEPAAREPCPSLIPVKGKVTFKGEPLTTGLVRFEPDDFGRPASGKLQSDGTFVLSTLKEGDGVVAGHHRVSITSLDPKSKAAAIRRNNGLPRCKARSRRLRLKRPSSLSTFLEMTFRGSRAISLAVHRVLASAYPNISHSRTLECTTSESVGLRSTHHRRSRLVASAPHWPKSFASNRQACRCRSWSEEKLTG